jgi:hypothetical protein
MKQKEIVLRASRFSLIMAFVLGAIFGLNSCRDEFNDEDALRLELSALEKARLQADSARNQRLKDSLNSVLIQQLANDQFILDSIENARAWLRYKDSLRAIQGVFNLSVNVVYGNTATFNVGGRVSDAANVAGAQVFLAQTKR